MQAPGGGKRDRTDDLLLAKQALFQLSYAPVPEAWLMIGKGCGDGDEAPNLSEERPSC